MGDIEGYDILYEKGYLGHGSYGSVYKARNKETGEMAAMKRIIVQSYQLESKMPSIRNEIKYITELGDKHKNILKLIKTKEHQEGPRMYVMLITELCSLKDLEFYALEYYLTIGHRVKIMYQCACGLAFMHRQKPPVIHRDVKPSNILMTEENGQHVVRLADFGLAREVEGSRSVKTMTNAGTETYMSPEQFDETDYWAKEEVQFHKSGAQDAFALGIVFYQLLQSDPKKGIECPEVTKASIGKVMMRIGEVEAEVDKNRDKWEKEEIERRESMSWLESKEQAELRKSQMESRETERREDLWKVKNIAKLKKIPPTKYWNPVVMKDSDSPLVKAVKEVIESVVKFHPRERSSMAEVEARLEDIIKDMPQPWVPVLTSFIASDHVPQMQKLKTHKLTFDVSIYMGFSSRRVILEDKDNDELVLLSLTEAGYNTVWEKPRPDGVRPDSYKYILSDGNIVFRHDEDNVTVVCDGDLNPIHTHTGDYGRLCGVVQGENLMYSKESESKYVLDMYNYKSHQHVCRLSVSVSSDGICTASHPASGWFVVTDWQSETMSMFTSDYQLHRQVQLGFTPHSPNGVCCVDNLIAVVKWGVFGWEAIVWYTWFGEEVKRVGREEVGVKGEIYGVGDGGEGRIQMYTWDDCTEQKHLYVFQV